MEAAWAAARNALLLRASDQPLQALANADADEVYRRYKAGRIAYYQNLVSRQPSLSKFLNGWLNRVNSFPDV